MCQQCALARQAGNQGGQQQYHQQYQGQGQQYQQQQQYQQYQQQQQAQQRQQQWWQQQQAQQQQRAAPRAISAYKSTAPKDTSDDQVCMSKAQYDALVAAASATRQK